MPSQGKDKELKLITGGVEQEGDTSKLVIHSAKPKGSMDIERYPIWDVTKEKG